MNKFTFYATSRISFKICVLFVFLSLSHLSILSTPLSTVLHPEYTLSIDSNRYIIDFVMPDYKIMREYSLDSVEEAHFGPWREMKEDDNCPLFDVIDVNADCDYTDVTSYPELPFFSIDLLIPHATENIRVTFHPTQIAHEHFNHYVQPVIIGNDSNKTCFNSQYYTCGYDDAYPNGFYRNFYTQSDIYTYEHRKGITLSIFPFSYYPHHNEAEVLKSGRFIIEFDRGDLITEITDILNSNNTSTISVQLLFNTFDDHYVDLTKYQSPSYLIVAARTDMASHLKPYVDYKKGQGYDTHIIYLEQYGKLSCNGMELTDFINANEICTNPDYVLLVGDTKDIPPFMGCIIDTDPYTDDPYHPHLGRWIVKNKDWKYPSLDTIVTKTLESEYNYTQFNSYATLFSGVDDKKAISRRFFRIIKYLARNSFAKMSVPYTLYDGRSAAVNFNSMQSALQAHPRFFIYNGHGSGYPSPRLSKPYYLMPTMYNSIYSISSLHNTVPFPMGFGFACSLNTYEVDDSFGANWVSEGCGGVSFYGSTTISYLFSNYCLSRRLFITLKQLTIRSANFPISLWIEVAETKYKNALNTNTRITQANRYNLIGDPTLYVYGCDYKGDIAPFHSPKKNFYKDNFNNEKEWNMMIFDVMGRLFYQGKSTTDIQLPSGLYIVQYTTEDSTRSEIKYIQ